MSKLRTKLDAPCRIFLSLAFLLFSIHYSLFTASAQTANATLSGVVEDQKGDAVPGVKITITNPATGLRRTVVTDENGTYVIPLLTPATYEVLAEADNFKRVLLPGVVLNVNDQRSLRIQLEAGNISEEVTVRPDEGVAVRTDPAVATVIPGEIARNMPLNGRSFSQLALLIPGVTVVGSVTGFGQISVNGQRASANYFTVDGVGANFGIGSTPGAGDSAGAYPSQSASGGTTGLVSVDALEEFKVQTSTYTADSGRQPGAQVQVLTRSGKNEFNASIFEYFRNEALDARNYFNTKPQPQAPLRQNIFGGTFGGPLPFLNFGDGGGPLFKSGKDRTFFFFSYEAHRLLIPVSGVRIVPSIRLRNAAHSSLQPILRSYPVPTRSELLTTTACPAPPLPPNPACDTNSNRLFSGLAQYDYSFSNPSDLDATSIRIDHKFNRQHAIFGRFSDAPSDSITGIQPLTRNIQNSRVFTAGLNSAFTSTFLNEFRFNLSRSYGTSNRFLTNLGGGVPFDETLLNYGNGGTGNITLNGFAAEGGISGADLALGLGSNVTGQQRQLNIIDNLTFILGKHQFKGGLDFRRLKPTLAYQNGAQITISGEAGVRNATLSSGSIQRRLGAEPQFDNWSLYFQDTWRIAKRVTLDLGLRWEYNPTPQEKNGLYPRGVLGVEGTDVSGATLAPEGKEFFKTFYNAFAPRLGAAAVLRERTGWETVLRGGFGVYYDLNATTISFAWPMSASRSLTGTGNCLVYPLTPTCSALPSVNPSTSTGLAFAEDLALPYTFQWNVTAEQSIAGRQVLSVAYVASAARQLLTRQALNQQPRDPFSGALLPRPNPAFGPINYTYNGPTSDYQSMQVQYKARLHGRLQALLNYTWSHAIDEISTDFNGLELTRGNAGFDVRHNMSAAVHFDIPTLFDQPVLKQLFENWSVDGLVWLRSGLPINITSGQVVIEDVQVNVRPDLVPGQPLYLDDPSVPGGRRFNSAAFSSPIQCLPAGASNCVFAFVRQGSFGRNILRELPLHQVDLALGRKFRFGEKREVLIKAEAFNVFNHPMFGRYGAQYLTPTTFGVPTATMNSSLGGLNALYQLGGPRSIQLSARLSF